MRDLILAAVFAVLVSLIFRIPEIGVYLWAWISIMNPHTYTFGFARSAPWALISAMVAFLALFTRVRKPVPWNSVTAAYVFLILWVTVTSILSVNEPAAVWDRWIFVIKIHLMMFVTIITLRGRAQIETLVWIVAGSIAFYGVKGGIFTVLTGGGGRVWGPEGSMIYGNNELAVAMVMIMPLLYYLFQTVSRRSLRWGIGAAMALTALAILGTQSRGALLAILAMAFALGLKSHRPVRTSAAIVAVVMLAMAFMPRSWDQRMETIQTFQQDASAMSRIYTWKTLWALALDRPLVGAGFRADNEKVFNTYAPTDPEFEPFRRAGTVLVAHSIYFQALGEHGFVGLVAYLLIGLLAYRRASRLSVSTSHDPEFAVWVPLLMRMAQTSLVGFAVGGAFLSLMNFDVPFYIVGLIVLTDATVREHVTARQSAVASSPYVGTRSPPSRKATP